MIQAEFDYITAILKPKIFDHLVPGNIIDQIDKSFLKLCTSLEANGVLSPKKISYYEFNAKIDYFEEVNTRNVNNNQHETD